MIAPFAACPLWDLVPSPSVLRSSAVSGENFQWRGAAQVRATGSLVQAISSYFPDHHSRAGGTIIPYNCIPKYCSWQCSRGNSKLSTETIENKKTEPLTLHCFFSLGRFGTGVHSRRQLQQICRRERLTIAFRAIGDILNQFFGRQVESPLFYASSGADSLPIWRREEKSMDDKEKSLFDSLQTPSSTPSILQPKQRARR
jgi:hypothetical protein